MYQNKSWTQYEETFFWTQQANVDMKQASLNPAEGLTCGKLLIGHLSLNVPIRVHAELKTSEYMGSEEKLCKCNEQTISCSDFQFFQKHARTKTGKKNL